MKWFVLVACAATFLFAPGCSMQVNDANPSSQVLAGGTNNYSPVPKNLSPSSGPSSGGTQVTITGLYFQQNAEVYFGSQLANSVTFNSSTSLTATAPSSSTGTFLITVKNPDGQKGTYSGYSYFASSPANTPPVSLSLTLTSQSVAEGTCYKVAINPRDANDVITTATQVVNVSLSVTGVGNFYLVAGCSQMITGTSIAAGNSETDVYYEATTLSPSTTLKVVDSSGQLSPYSVDFSVSSGTPTTLTLSLPSGGFSATECNVEPLAVQLFDVEGNPATLAGSDSYRLTVSINNSNDTFYSDSQCHDPIGEGSFSATIIGNPYYFYYKPSAAGTRTLQASAQDNLNSTLTLSAPNEMITVSGGPLTTLSFSVGGSALSLNTCTPYTTVGSDSIGESASITSATVINLSATAPILIYGTMTCTGDPISQITLPAGSPASASFYLKSTTGGLSTLNVATANVPALTLPIIIESTNPASQVGFIPNTISLPGDNICNAITVYSEDGAKNPALAATNITINWLSTSQGSFYSNSGCTTETDTSVIMQGQVQTTVYYSQAAAQANAILSANPANANVGSGSLSVNFVAGAATRITFSQDSPILDATCTSYTLGEVDANSNPVSVNPPVMVQLTGKFYSDRNCTVPITQISLSGTAANIWFEGTGVGDYGFAASYSNLSGSYSVQVLENYNPGSIVVASTTQLTTGNLRHYMLLNLLDKSGNPMTAPNNYTVTVSTTGHLLFCSGEGTNCTNNSLVVTFPQGASSLAVYYVSNTSFENNLITVNPGGNLAMTTITLLVTPYLPTITLSPASPIFTGQCVLVTGQMVDNVNNPVIFLPTFSTALSLTGGILYTDPGCKNLISSSNPMSVSNSSGQFSFYVSSPTAFNGQLGLTFAGYPFSYVTSPLIVSPTPASAVSLYGPTMGQPGLCLGPYFAVSEDPNHNQSVPPQPDNFSVTAQGAQLFADGACSQTLAASIPMATPQSAFGFYVSNPTASGTVSIQLSTQHLGTAALSLAVTVPTLTAWTTLPVDAASANQISLVQQNASWMNSAILDYFATLSFFKDPGLEFFNMSDGILNYSPESGTWMGIPFFQLNGGGNAFQGWAETSTFGTSVRNTIFTPVLANSLLNGSYSLQVYRPGNGVHVPLGTASPYSYWLPAIPSTSLDGKMVFVNTNTGYVYDPGANQSNIFNFGTGPVSPGIRAAVGGNYAFVLAWDGGESNIPNGFLINLEAGNMALLPSSGAPSPRASAFVTWTGKVFLVYGGYSSAQNAILFDGATFDPVANAWTPISPVGAPTSLTNYQTAVWADKRMIVCGTSGVGTSSCYTYDPSAQVWEALTSTNLPKLPSLYAIGWTGTNLLLWQMGNDTASSDTLLTLPVNLNQ